jgi:hypothetical protein
MPGIEPALACRGCHDAFRGNAIGTLRGRILREGSMLMRDAAKQDRCCA